MFGSKYPIIRINASIQESNKHEIPHFKEFFKGMTDELRLNTVYNPQMENKWLKGEHRIVKRKGCPQIYQRMIVDANGDAVPCCVDYKKNLNRGNVNNQSLEYIYQDGFEPIRRAQQKASW